MSGLLIVSVVVDSEAMGDVEKNAARGRRDRFAVGDPDMLTRAQVAQRLGISLAEVKRRERVGHIEPFAINEQGWHLYHVDQLDQIRNCTATANRQKRITELVAYSGEEAAKVFAELDDGTSLRDCVKKFALHPAVVDAIAVAWARMEDALFVSGNVMEKINRLPLDGNYPIQSDVELLEIMEQAANEKCNRCKKNARSVCIRCAVRMPRDSAL